MSDILQLAEPDQIKPPRSPTDEHIDNVTAAVLKVYKDKFTAYWGDMPTAPAKIEIITARIRELERKRDKAALRGWLLSAQRHNSDIVNTADDLIVILRDATSRLLAVGTGHVPTVPIEKRLRMDIASLTRHFSDVEFTANTAKLSAVVKEVVLAHILNTTGREAVVPLGRFRIEVFLDRLLPPYTGNFDIRRTVNIIALDPKPARKEEGATEFFHPHVAHGELCFGEGTQPCLAAALDGRIFDFFDLIGVVLNTYNPGNPHIMLEKWIVPGCASCDAAFNDKKTKCPRCRKDFCHNCTSACSSCKDATCISCIGNCGEADCRHQICKNSDLSCSGVCQGCQDKDADGFRCPAHRRRCHCCGDDFCSKHGSTCKLCGMPTCNYCTMPDLTKPGEEFCIDHLAECSTPGCLINCTASSLDPETGKCPVCSGKT